MQETKKPQAFQRRGEAFWRRAVMAQRDSDSTQEDFCRRHGLALSTFHRWRQRLRGLGAPQHVSVRPSFVEVKARPERTSPPSTDGEAGFELEFSSGVCLRLPSRVDGQGLAEVLCVLQARDLC